MCAGGLFFLARRLRGAYAYLMGTNTVACGKCDGSGRIKAFGHIESGRCFGCAGTGRLDASKLTQSSLKPVDVANYVAEQRAHYARHYATARTACPALSAAEFRAAALVHAERARIEDKRDAIEPGHWALGAYEAMLEFAGE